MNKKLNSILKLIVAVMLISALSVSLFACGGGDDGTTTNANAEFKAKADAFLSESGEKTIEDNFKIQLQLNISNQPVYIDLDVDLYREFDGDELTKIGGSVNSVKASGAISAVINLLGNFVSGFDLNKLAKRAADVADVEIDGATYPVYVTKKGMNVYEITEGEGDSAVTTIYKETDGSVYSFTANEDDYAYLELYRNGEISFTNVAEGYIEINSAGEIVVWGKVSLSGLFAAEADAPYNTGVLWSQIEEVMDDYDIAINFDMIGLQDYTMGTATATNNGYTVKMTDPAAALNVLVGQFFTLLDNFVEGEVEYSTYFATVNSFLDSTATPITNATKVSEDQTIEELLNDIRRYADKYRGIFGDDFDEAVDTLIDLDQYDATVVLKGDKLSKISGTQVAYVTLTQAQFESVLGYLGTDIPSISSILGLVKTAAFPMLKDSNNNIVVTATFEYTSEFDY